MDNKLKITNKYTLAGALGEGEKLFFCQVDPVRRGKHT